MTFGALKIRIFEFIIRYSSIRTPNYSLLECLNNNIDGPAHAAAFLEFRFASIFINLKIVHREQCCTRDRSRANLSLPPNINFNFHLRMQKVKAPPLLADKYPERQLQTSL